MDTGIDARRATAPARRSRGVPAPLFWGFGALLVAAAAGVTVGILPLGGAVRAQTFDLTDYAGAELFERFCAACHGPGGEGDGPVAGTLNVLVPDLTRLAERHDGRFPAMEIRDVIDGRALVIAHGPRTMPVWGYEFWIEEGADVVAEADARELINRLVTHIESIQRETGPAGQFQ